MTKIEEEKEKIIVQQCIGDHGTRGPGLRQRRMAINSPVDLSCLNAMRASLRSWILYTILKKIPMIFQQVSIASLGDHRVPINLPLPCVLSNTFNFFMIHVSYVFASICNDGVHVDHLLVGKFISNLHIIKHYIIIS